MTEGMGYFSMSSYRKTPVNDFSVETSTDIKYVLTANGILF